jgi:hypothetical protein
VPPPKRVPQTDAIFERLSRVNPQADEAPDTLRLSLDAMASAHQTPCSDRTWVRKSVLRPQEIILPRRLSFSG